MHFEIIGSIDGIEVIARGKSIRDLARLKKKHGPGNWRKLKGFATVKLENGGIHRAEIHWYEAHGVGRRGLKIKQILD